MAKIDKKQANYDAIVIGSGIGGLTVAGLLAKVNKKKVLVFEQHSEIGGLTHEVRRGPYSWDPGVHYVGNFFKRKKDIILPLLFDYLTEGKLKWNKMPHIFEKFKFPGMTINVPDSKKAFKNALIEQFPLEKQSIKTYFRDIHKAQWFFIRQYITRFVPGLPAFILKAINYFQRRFYNLTTKQYLDSTFKNNKLKAVLSSRWGDYGLPPAESAFIMHALIEDHYSEGGIYPDKGAEQINFLIENTIEKNGGQVLFNRDVKEILIENNKAVGVNVYHKTKNEYKKYYASLIISAVGKRNTFFNLLSDQPHLPIQQQLKDFHKGYSAINLYLGLRESPQKLGIMGENYWISDSFDMDLFYQSTSQLTEGKAKYCFVSFPSLKNGKPHIHTAEAVVIFPHSLFVKWQEYEWKERNTAYYELKDKISDAVLNLIEKYIPGLKNLIVYKEVSTPLTFEHFTRQGGGAFYGLPAIPERYLNDELQKIKSPFKNLYFAGSDVCALGIGGAMLGGLATASFLNGPLGFLIIFLKSAYFSLFLKNKIRKNKKIHITEDKILTSLIKKRLLNKTVYELTFDLKQEILPTLAPYLKMQVGVSDWRSYSIASIKNREIVLIIDTKDKGLGSDYVKKLQIGDSILFRLPANDIKFNETGNKLMFIATGTGFVPIYNILKHLQDKKYQEKIVLLFGCLKEEAIFIEEYLDTLKTGLDLESVICVEQTELDTQYFQGRVTDFLAGYQEKIIEYDFYICGHPHMTSAVHKYLRETGVERIYW